MPKVFSRQTLLKFEDASASIVLRQIDRAFEGAEIRVGEDPGGPGGDRRTQFRRYVANVDQHDPHQLDRLGAALGALIAAVATSKEEFLVKAAESDGFSFADGVFRVAETASMSFAVTRVEDLALIDERCKRLHLLARDRPNDAIFGAIELADSVCQTVLRLIGAPAAGKTANLVEVATSTLKAFERVSSGIDDAKKDTALVHKCLLQLGAVLVSLGELLTLDGFGKARDGTWKGLSPRHARLAVGAAVTFAGFVAETYVERAVLKSGKRHLKH